MESCAVMVWYPAGIGSERGRPRDGPPLASDDRGHVEDPDDQAAGHPEQLAESPLRRPVAKGQQDRPDQRQAARDGEQTGEQLRRRPGHPTS